MDGDSNVKDYTWFGVDKYLFVILWPLSCCACFVEPFGVCVSVCLSQGFRGQARLSRGKQRVLMFDTREASLHINTNPGPCRGSRRNG